MGVAKHIIHVTLVRMKYRALLPIFAATLFTSAFLIFAVQPMVSKMLLPMLGGSPSVWNTAMVFFQAMLLAGYGYAHFVARFVPLRAQAVLHIILLLFFTTVLPLSLPPGTQPPEEGGQALWQLGVMLACVGGPFFVLAASAPLFQHWFSASGHEDAENPYFLYAVSNIGSMVSLLSYPIIIEPLLGLHNQTQAWFTGYIVLIVLTAVCAFLVRNGAKPAAPLPTAEDRKPITWLSRAVWIALSFIPSSLMLGVTTIVTTDLASAPFLWILPLTIYLITFIIAFAKEPKIGVPVARELAAYAIIFVIVAFMISGFVTLEIPMIIMHLLAFFICSQLCHGELAKAKPSASHLTEYFLLISLGGVLGGIFNALIAPKIFLIPIEYSMTLASVGFVIWAGTAKIPFISKTFNSLDEKLKYKKLLAIDIVTIAAGLLTIGVIYVTKTHFVQVIGTFAIFAFFMMIVQNRFVFSCVACAALLTFQPGMWSMSKKLIDLDRNYFGVLKVYTQKNINFFYHGTTLHGAEFQNEEWKLIPVVYYNPAGPTADIFNYMSKRIGKQKIAALGLGVGSIACYKAPKRHFDFYEIDADVVRIAEDPKYFSYLSGCGNYNIVLGDARLKMNDAPDESYDIVFVDTFSSDNIPVHIMTKEGFEVYLKKLKPHGIIGMNISNRYFDLRPVLTSIAGELGLTIYFKYDAPKKVKDTVSELYTESLFAVMARDPNDVAPFMENDGWKPLPPAETPARAWTDDYANVLSSMFMWERLGIKQRYPLKPQ